MSDQHFSRDDFVYVDPESRTVVGVVQWDKTGCAIQKEKPDTEAKKQEDKPKRRNPKKRYFPWGSYGTMAKIFRLEKKGKDKEVESYISLDDAISRLQGEPFWD